MRCQGSQPRRRLRERQKPGLKVALWTPSLFCSSRSSVNRTNATNFPVLLGFKTRALRSWGRRGSRDPAVGFVGGFWAPSRAGPRAPAVTPPAWWRVSWLDLPVPGGWRSAAGRAAPTWPFSRWPTCGCRPSGCPHMRGAGGGRPAPLRPVLSLPVIPSTQPSGVSGTISSSYAESLTFW